MSKDTTLSPKKNIEKFAKSKYRTVQKRINLLRKAALATIKDCRLAESPQEMEVALLRLEVAVAKSTPTIRIDLTKDAEDDEHIQIL